jgi:phage tail-like protein
MGFPIPPLSLDQLTGPPLSHRFAVFFLIGGFVPNPLDVRFQRVSGLSARVDTQTLAEGGQNLYTHKLPTRIGYDNLTLERGFVVGSLLNVEFNATMSLFKFAPSNVMVTLLDETGIPLAAWMFIKAYPVRWATADLNASDERVLIDTLELAYTRMQALRI